VSTMDGLAEHAHRIRERVVDMCAGPEGGHLGGAMSLVEILVALYFGIGVRDPEDVVLLSKGHGALGLYATLAERGLLTEADIADYGRPGSRLMGHPVRGVPGIAMPAGSLGHGLALANGYALAGRRCFVLLGDGELQEGSVWEAAMATASLELDRVIAIVDRNGLQITGRTEDAVRLEPLPDKWSAFGWAVRECDGHDCPALLAALTDTEPGRPTAVIAHTVKGRGLPYVEGRRESHYARLGPRAHQRARTVLARRA